MKKILFIIPFFIIGGVIYYFLVENNKNDRELPALLNVATDFVYQDACDSAVDYASRIIQSAKNPNNLAFAHTIIGYCEFENGNLDSAFAHYDLARTHTLSSDSLDYYLLVEINAMLGSIFEEYEKYYRAAQYFKEAINILSKYERPFIADAHYNLAFCQSQLNDIKCIKTYYQAIGYSQKYNNHRIESMCLNDLGHVMLETHNYESAREHYEASLATKYALSNYRIQYFAYQGIGESYYYEDKLGKSKENLDKALALMLLEGDNKNAFSVYHFLGKLMAKFKYYKQAEEYYDLAIQLLPYAQFTRKNIEVYADISFVQSIQGKTDLSTKNHTTHYELMNQYIDRLEHASKLVQQDTFDSIVNVTESSFRDNLPNTLQDGIDKNGLPNFIFLLCFTSFSNTAMRKMQPISIC